MCTQLMSVVCGLLHGCLSCPTEWKLSIYVAKSLLVVCVNANYAYVLQSPDPLIAYLVNHFVPFVLTFGIMEIARHWQWLNTWQR